MTTRREILIASAVLPVAAVVDFHTPLTQDDLRLLAIAAAPDSKDVHEYNRNRIVRHDRIEKLVDRGMLVLKPNTINRDAKCENFASITDLGRNELRRIGVES
jgi:hypothetical protein